MAADQIKPAYLIAGTDEGKIMATISRLRARAEREGGPGALEAFAAEPGARGGPDAEALVAAMPALSLTAERRYLLADGVERWSAKQASLVVEALGALPPETVVVLVAREEPPRLRAPKKLADAVEKAGGEVRRYEAPRARDLPAWLVAEASRRELELDRDAAGLLVERMGESTVRLGNELDRLALWAGPGGRVTRADLAAMVADTSEEVAWALSDALVAADPAGGLRAAERLAGQGESVTGLIYQAAKRLRAAHAARAALDAGRPAKQVEADLPMHPYAAKMLVRQVGETSTEELRDATCAVADLEWWTRGGSEYPEPVALTLAIRRATASV
ncbi:MAG TPA: DNA polymerase III subunit delta [Solirubrobacterales bacterium]|nr:DNA polymerase III subunit delta [Solirubrobacterales bacterium]